MSSFVGHAESDAGPTFANNIKGLRCVHRVAERLNVRTPGVRSVRRDAKAALPEFAAAALADIAAEFVLGPDEAGVVVDGAGGWARCRLGELHAAAARRYAEVADSQAPLDV